MFTAVIPVRAGSRRLPNKNIAPFNGTNLLINKIKQLKKVKEIGNIVVSSDSDVMLDMAKDQGVHTHRRDLVYCDEKTKSFGEVVRHICESVDGDNIIWATCTSPLVTPDIYRKAIREYLEIVVTRKEHDSLVSMEPFQRYVWDDKGPVNYQLGRKHVPSQNLPVLYYVTDGILIAPRLSMIEWYYFHGRNPYRFVLDKRSSVDIDDAFDLAKAKAWLKINLDKTPGNQ